MNQLTRDCYLRLVRPILFQMDPERAHHLALLFLRAAPYLPGGGAILRGFAPAPRPRRLFGLQFRYPVGLAAGFDKNAVAIPAWEALGFGFVEIGTVTAQPQPGNPRPRIFRYPGEEALINRLGFNNDGAKVIAERLRRLRASKRAPSIPIGINLGKSRSVRVEDAADDYRESFQRLAPVADYIVLNVSSPNTPALRSLQEHGALERLLRVITDENTRLAGPRPLLLKIAPDLSEDALSDIVSLCERFGLAGLIATNTTLDHSVVADKNETGGLSGRPLRARATAVIRFLRDHTKLPIIGVGGIADPDSAREKQEAGAELLQVYTGYVFRGPNLLCDIDPIFG